MTDPAADRRVPFFRWACVVLAGAIVLNLIPGPAAVATRPADPLLTAVARSAVRLQPYGRFFHLRTVSTQTFDMGGYRLVRAFRVDRVHDLQNGKYSEQAFPARLRPATVADATAWDQAGKPIPAEVGKVRRLRDPATRRWRHHEGWFIGFTGLDSSQLRELDPNDEALRRWVDEAAHDLVRAPISPALRARVYGVLAVTPGVRSERAALDGRQALRVSVGGQSFWLDLRTGAYLGTDSLRVEVMEFTDVPPEFVDPATLV
ncbi:hypothetical protein ACIBH1_31325 [Nonomuraea sp. NPDC050663]|uniref:hypothetical protein n=1 Tax=Nonomuraea sp. NPDC050663 TaxID=3364370 RepID=UPI003795F04E